MNILTNEPVKTKSRSQVKILSLKKTSRGIILPSMFGGNLQHTYFSRSIIYSKFDSNAKPTYFIFFHWLTNAFSISIYICNKLMIFASQNKVLMSSFMWTWTPKVFSRRYVRIVAWKKLSTITFTHKNFKHFLLYFYI